MGSQMTDYEAVIEILKAETSITDLIAKMVNQDGTTSTQEAIVFGDLPEAQNIYPAISVRQGTVDKFIGIETRFLMVNCWAETMAASIQLGEAVDELFTDSFCTASDYAFNSTSDIIATVSDGVYYNTAVNIKITYIRR